MASLEFGPDAIREAYKVVSAQLPPTPVFTSTKMNQMSGLNLFFKAENLQKTGSFKARGALFAVTIDIMAFVGLFLYRRQMPAKYFIVICLQVDSLLKRDPDVPGVV